MILKLVSVAWIDARTLAGWHDYDPKNPPSNPPMRTFGLLVDDREDAVVVASSFDTDTSQFADLSIIPKGLGVLDILTIAEVNSDRWSIESKIPKKRKKRDLHTGDD